MEKSSPVHPARPVVYTVAVRHLLSTDIHPPGRPGGCDPVPVSHLLREGADMRTRILLAVVILFGAGGLARAQDKPLERTDLDKRVVGAVYEAALRGTDI